MFLDPTMSEEGETVITEEEFINIKKLKELKSTYRADHEDFKTLKSEVQYCQKLVEQCRQKLVQEFDNWYSESFLSPDAPQTSIEAGLGVPPGVQDDDEVVSDMHVWGRFCKTLIAVCTGPTHRKFKRALT